MIGAYKQTATYWAPATRNGYNEKTYGSPTTLKVRWEEKTELIIGKGGEQIVSKSRVWIKAGQSIVRGGYLYLGTSVATDPEALGDAYIVLDVEVIPSVLNVESLTKVYL